MNSAQPIDIIPSIDTTEWGVLYEDGSCKWFNTEQDAIKHIEMKERTQQ